MFLYNVNMKKDLKKKIFYGIIVFSVFSSLTVLTSAGWMGGVNFFGDRDHGYRTTVSNILEIRDLPFDKGLKHQGYKVINTSGNEYFIPTRTQEEWEAFKNHLPTGVTLESLYPRFDIAKFDDIF